MFRIFTIILALVQRSGDRNIARAVTLSFPRGFVAWRKLAKPTVITRSEATWLSREVLLCWIATPLKWLAMTGYSHLNRLKFLHATKPSRVLPVIPAEAGI